MSPSDITHNPRVKAATGFICTDEKIFDTQELAEIHQTGIDLEDALLMCLKQFYEINNHIDAECIAKQLANRLPPFIANRILVVFPEDDDE